MDLRAISFFSIFRILALVSVSCALVFSADTRSFAAVISNSGVEVEYSYKIEFRSITPITNRNLINPLELAQFHAEHIFGVFQSPKLAIESGVPSELTGGFAGPKHPTIFSVKTFSKPNDSYLWLTYSTRSKALLLKKLADKIFKSTNEVTVELPLLINLPLVYKDGRSGFQSKKWLACGDKHYPDPNDFSYFYDPFRCPELGREPIGQSVPVKFRKLRSKINDNEVVPLEELRANNQNGRLTVLYFAYGYEGNTDDLDRVAKDTSWKLFQSLGKNLIRQFHFTEVHSTEELRQQLGSDFDLLNLQTLPNLDFEKQKRFFRTYVRIDGDIKWVVRSALLNTDNEPLYRPLVSFPKFWKEAWENGDFIYYGGHSGDGQSLDYNTIVSNLRKIDLRRINFKKTKTQIVFFDSCTSYAHFTDMYLEQKPKGLSIISYGLVSLFHLAEPTAISILTLLTGGSNNETWVHALEQIEKDQLLPDLKYSYGANYANKVYPDYVGKGLFPSYLLNVATPAN